ncbi:uncharacterized protein B0H18DRAFT_1120643 [Fomitopsis serialis]|uniref:uncharacterized protein n=1 Tax=Fomitopsis serialis TaxID=139415 RepID=UPI0020087EB9|nr:uncharacterized protein B0H18DRAFT_1120643 [Neoantrodia serialis]KAH9922923.1 hypothetical protein B0H18DRAFT_1120643 [Neoantrodia serialis]
MDRRYPSTSSAVDSKCSIRHRSGAYSPSLSDARARRRTSRRRVVAVEDYGHEQTRGEDEGPAPPAPTITLVRAGRNTPVTPTLPPFSRTNTLDVPLWDESLWSSSPREEPLSPPNEDLPGPAHHTLYLSPVPLTPRPQPPREHSACSFASAHTSASRISPLPTPNFAARAGDAVRSYFPRLRSFVSTRAASETATAVDPRPPHARHKSSSYSTESGGSTAVSDVPSRADGACVGAARPGLLPSFSTADKLTRKFPRPRSVKNLTFRGGGNASLAATVLEEGEGLGIGSVDRWSVHKWCLLLSVSTLLVYGLAGLICAVLTWFRTYEQAGVMVVADNDILVLITLSSSILLLCFLVGISGTILNSRPILARDAFSLDRKLNLAWSQWYTPLGRLILQDSLRCCGYYDALHEATASNQCYPRTPLPGCKGKLLRYERENLATIWSAATFGKGIMPKRYWLSNADLHADAERFKDAFSETRPVARPGPARQPLSTVFREDREENDRS